MLVEPPNHKTHLTHNIPMETWWRFEEDDQKLITKANEILSEWKFGNGKTYSLDYVLPNPPLPVSKYLPIQPENDATIAKLELNFSDDPIYAYVALL